MPELHDNKATIATSRASRNRLSEQLANTAFKVCTFLSAAIALSLIGIFVWQFTAHSFELSQVHQTHEAATAANMWMLLNGTVLTTSLALLISVPLGLAGAIFLTDFASPKLRLFLKGTLEVLAVVPPIVWAFLAVAGLADMVSAGEPSALLAGITLGLMVLPMTATLMEDAIFHVPTPLLEGAVALGATRSQALIRVVLPTAAPGIAAAALLSLSRAVAETVILSLAAGDVMRFTIDPRQAVETVTGFILRAGMHTERPEVHLETAFIAGAMLFVITGVLHVMAGRLLRRKAT
jgi:phosphate transport system permease protein